MSLQLDWIEVGIYGSGGCFDAVCFYFEGAGFFVFAVVTRVVAIGFFLLIEVKTDFEIASMDSHIGVKSWIASRCEWTNKAHLLAILSLKSIADATKKIGGIVRDIGDGKFHTS